MKINVKIWKEVKQAISESRALEIVYDSSGLLTRIISEIGERYEFDSGCSAVVDEPWFNRLQYGDDREPIRLSWRRHLHLKFSLCTLICRSTRVVSRLVSKFISGYHGPRRKGESNSYSQQRRDRHDFVNRRSWVQIPPSALNLQVLVKTAKHGRLDMPNDLPRFRTRSAKHLRFSIRYLGISLDNWRFDNP